VTYKNGKRDKRVTEAKRKRDFDKIQNLFSQINNKYILGLQTVHRTNASLDALLPSIKHTVTGKEDK
jgi:hypothetical protein